MPRRSAGGLRILPQRPNNHARQSHPRTTSEKMLSHMRQASGRQEERIAKEQASLVAKKKNHASSHPKARAADQMTPEQLVDEAIKRFVFLLYLIQMMRTQALSRRSRGKLPFWVAAMLACNLFMPTVLAEPTHAAHAGENIFATYNLTELTQWAMNVEQQLMAATAAQAECENMWDGYTNKRKKEYTDYMKQEELTTYNFAVITKKPWTIPGGIATHTCSVTATSEGLFQIGSAPVVLPTFPKLSLLALSLTLQIRISANTQLLAKYTSRKYEFELYQMNAIRDLQFYLRAGGDMAGEEGTQVISAIAENLEKIFKTKEKMYKAMAPWQKPEVDAELDQFVTPGQIETLLLLAEVLNMRACADKITWKNAVNTLVPKSCSAVLSRLHQDGIAKSSNERLKAIPECRPQATISKHN